MKESREKSEKLLRSHKLRVTEKRLDVLKIIHDYGSAIPYSKVQEQLKNLDRVTLYRTILALLENGIIHKIQVEGQEVYYALCGHTCDTEEHNHQHIHFHCSECEKVSCIEPKQELKVLLEGCAIAEVKVQVDGVCAACVSK